MNDVREMLIQPVRDLSGGAAEVEIWDFEQEKSLGKWVALDFYRNSTMIFLNPENPQYPSVLEFHNIGIVDDKEEYFAVTDKDKKPLGIWVREYPLKKLLFKHVY